MCYNGIKEVIFVQTVFQSNGFRFDFKESPVKNNLLWESHCHGQFEMIGVVKGDITVNLEGKRYRLGEGQYALIPPLTYHTVTANQQGTYRRVTVLFGREAIPQVLRRPLSVREDLFIGRSDQLTQLTEICKEPNHTFYAPLANSIMVQILYQSVREKKTDTSARIDDSLARMLEYIDDHLCEKICLDDIAAHAACSKSSVSHLFEDRMKITPKQYILQKRLALAEALLQEGVPASETALRVGYDNYSNFYRIYRKHFGTPPSKKTIPPTEE